MTSLYEEMRPSGHMHYYNANDRLRSGFPGNRLKYANIPRLEVSFDVDYIAFSFNPNRIVLGNSAGRITFNRVEKILMYSGQFCGDAAYIFCKDSDTVYCVQFDKYWANGKGGEQSPPFSILVSLLQFRPLGKCICFFYIRGKPIVHRHNTAL